MLLEMVATVHQIAVLMQMDFAKHVTILVKHVILSYQLQNV
jgi:hypothetical protein